MWVRNLLVFRFRRKSSRSPGGPKIGWGSPGALLGVPWSLLGALWRGDPVGPPPEDDPKVKQADFWSPPRVVPGWLQMLANGSKCLQIVPGVRNLAILRFF